MFILGANAIHINTTMSYIERFTLAANDEQAENVIYERNHSYHQDQI